jgi:DNA-binding transcriptional LysR family regulator
MHPWEFERGEEMVRITPAGRFTGGNFDDEVAAAIAGLGIIKSFEGFLEPYFADGRLESVLPDWWQSFTGPFLYYPSRRLMPAPLRAFVDFIRRP